MIVRAILENPGMATDFDYDNDYDNTVAWLRSLGGTPQSIEAIRRLSVGFLRPDDSPGQIPPIAENAMVDFNKPNAIQFSDTRMGIEEHKPDALLDEFVTLEEERLAAEQRIKAIKERTKQIESVLLDEWADRGLSQVKMRGRTVFIRNDFYCSKKGGVATDDVCAQLTKLGLSHMVNPGYAPASLKSLVREMVDEGREVPEGLRELLRYDTTPRLMTRAS